MNPHVVSPLALLAPNERRVYGMSILYAEEPQAQTLRRWSFPEPEAKRYARQGKDFDSPLREAFQKAATSCASVAIDDDVLGGTPRVAGTRIPLYMVLRAIRHFGDIDGAINEYAITREQVSDALAYAAAVLEQPREYEP